MNIKLPFVVLLFAFTLTNCSNENCEDWYEGDDCSTQQRDKFYGVYVGVRKTYNPQGDLVSEGPIELAIEQGTEINELRLTDQPDCVFVLTDPGETAFSIPDYYGGVDGTVFDFIIMGGLLILLCSGFKWVSTRTTNSKIRMVYMGLLVLLFLVVWVELGVGCFSGT